MAPTFRHGKATKVYVGGSDVWDILNSYSVDAQAETADTTAFGDDDRVFLVGQRSAVMTMDGMADIVGGTSAIDKVIEYALGSTGGVVISVGPEGDTIGRRALLGAAVATRHAVTSPADGVVSVSMQAQLTGKESPAAGVWLAERAARAAATTHASVDGGAATAVGGVAHLHLTAFSTSGSGTAELTMTIQDSSNDSVWGTLTTMTVNSTNVEQGVVARSTVAGTIKRYVRARATSQGAGSATYAVAFARWRS